MWVSEWPWIASGPWEMVESARELFLLATQMYFFYLIVNRAGVCTSNNGKTDINCPPSLPLGAHSELGRPVGRLPVHQSQRPLGENPKRSGLLAPRERAGGWSWEKEEKTR